MRRSRRLVATAAQDRGEQLRIGEIVLNQQDVHESFLPFKPVDNENCCWTHATISGAERGSITANMLLHREQAHQPRRTPGHAEGVARHLPHREDCDARASP